MAKIILSIALLCASLTAGSPNTALAAPAAQSEITAKCIQEVADFVGVKAGQTLKFKQQSNSPDVTCDVRVTYDQGALTFEFGIAAPKFQKIVLSPMQTNDDFHLDASCSINPNSSAGIYDSGVNYTKHRRSFDKRTGKLFGQEVFGLSLAKGRSSPVSFHFSALENNTMGEPDVFVSATCW